MKALIWFMAGLISMPAVAQRLPFSFKAKTLLVLSDADMAASAYIDGRLKRDEQHDALTLIQWSDSVQHIRTSRVQVANSVTNWVKALDVTPDQKVAFVAETRGSAPKGVEQVKNVSVDLPAGSRLFAIDLNDPTRLRLQDSVLVGSVPLTAAVHPTGKWIATVTREPGREITLVSWQQGKFGRIYSFPAETPPSSKNRRVTDVSWHPSGQYVAVTVEDTHEILFYRFDSVTMSLSPWGRLSTGSYPGAGQFTPNGRYYIVPDLKWDVGFDKPGALMAIRFDQEGKKHQLTATLPVGISPEGFAISPDGTRLATSNMGTAFMPLDSPLFGHSATISLISFDDATGQMHLLDEQAWEGLLPEGITFDASSKALAVTSFDALDLGGQHQGSLEFWTLTNQNKLQKTGFKLSLPRGAHYVKLIPQ